MQSGFVRVKNAIVSHRTLALVSIAAAAAAALGACGDDASELTTASSTASTSTTGSATTAASSTSSSSSKSSSAVTSTSAGTGSASTTTSSSSSSSSSGSGGARGAGGCIDPAVTASAFTIQTAELCVVASYTAPDLTLAPYGVEPSWGRHGGPLTSQITPSASSNVEIDRWSINGSTLTKADAMIAGVTQIPADGFGGAQAIDLPFGNLTAVAWSGADFVTDGGVVFVDATHATNDFLTTGAFGMAVTGSAASSRLFFTGLSALNGPTNDAAGLYSADFANGTFGASAAVSTWGNATGPVATDSAGNVIAINTDYLAGTQSIHGFAASTVTPGQPAIEGQELLSTDGFGSALAAVAPETNLAGLALFQPQTGATGTYDDVLVIRYTVSGNTVSALSSEALLKLTTANTNLTLMTDDQGRVWVGAPAATGSVFYVLARP